MSIVEKKRKLDSEINKEAKKSVVLGRDRKANTSSDFYERNPTLSEPCFAVNRASIIAEQAADVAPPDEAKWKALIMASDEAFEEAARQGQQSRAAALVEFAQWRDSLGEEDVGEYDLQQYVAIAETGEPSDEQYFDGNHLDTPMKMPLNLFFALASWETIHNAFGANSIRIWHLRRNLHSKTNVGVLSSLFDEQQNDQFEDSGNHAFSVMEHCASKSLFEDGTRYVDECLFSLAFLAPLDASLVEEGDLVEKAIAYTMLLPYEQHRWFRALMERTAQMIQPNENANVLVGAACHAPEGAGLLARLARRNGWRRTQLVALIDANLGVYSDSLFQCEVRNLDKNRILRAFDSL